MKKNIGIDKEFAQPNRIEITEQDALFNDNGVRQREIRGCSKLKKALTKRLNN